MALADPLLSLYIYEHRYHITQQAPLSYYTSHGLGYVTPGGRGLISRACVLLHIIHTAPCILSHYMSCRLCHVILAVACVGDDLLSRQDKVDVSPVFGNKHLRRCIATASSRHQQVLDFLVHVFDSLTRLAVRSAMSPASFCSVTSLVNSYLYV